MSPLSDPTLAIDCTEALQHRVRVLTRERDELRAKLDALHPPPTPEPEPQGFAVGQPVKVKRLGRLFGRMGVIESIIEDHHRPGDGDLFRVNIGSHLVPLFAQDLEG